MKIKRFIMGMLILFSLVPLYLFGGILIVRNQKAIEKFEGENLETLSSTIILNIESYCDSQRLAMQQLAQSEPVQQVLASVHGSSEPEALSYEYLCDLLEEHKTYEEYIVSVSVLDSGFRVVGSTEKSTLPFVIGPDVVPADELFWVGSAYGRETLDGKKQVVLACHRIERGGEYIGYVLEEIDTAYFDMLRSQMTLTENDMICVRDGDGGLITAGYFGKRAFSENAYRVTECEEYKRKWNEVGKRAESGGHITFSNGGVRYITYYSGIENTDWLIQVTIDISSSYAAVSSYRLLVVLSLLCLTLVLSAVNCVVTRRITQPFDRIESTLSEVQKYGDYSLRIHVDKKGEIGAIAERINRLLGDVQEWSSQNEIKQRQLQRDVELDPLTGIMNKKAIHEDLEELTARASDLKIEIMVGFVDVDNFRDFNTKYGHQIGDMVLMHVADCLRKAVPGIVGRNGGDEFIFCMLNRRKDIRLDQVMEDFYSGLKEGVLLESGEIVSVTCSVGVVRAKGASAAAELERDADTAMYEAKNKGKNTFHVITKSGKDENRI